MISIGSRAIARARATRLRHAAGEFGRHQPVCAAQADGVELHQHHVADQFFRQVGVLAHLVGDIVKDRDVGEQGAELEEHAHPPPQCVQFLVVQMRHRLPVDQHLAAARSQLAADQPQQRRLAATGTTHDGDDLAARDLQADAVEDRAILVGKIKAADLDEIFGRHAGIRGEN
jgi:hypothetical protein